MARRSHPRPLSPREEAVITNQLYSEVAAEYVREARFKLIDGGLTAKEERKLRSRVLAYSSECERYGKAVLDGLLNL